MSRMVFTASTSSKPVPPLLIKPTWNRRGTSLHLSKSYSIDSKILKLLSYDIRCSIHLCLRSCNINAKELKSNTPHTYRIDKWKGSTQHLQKSELIIPKIRFYIRVKSYRLWTSTFIDRFCCNSNSLITMASKK